MRQKPRILTSQLELDLAARGWGVTELAAQCGFEYQRVYRFLSGRTQTPATLKGIADALGQPVTRYLQEAP